MHDIPELDRSGLRSFGMTTGAILIALFGLLIPWLLGLTAFPRWPWFVGGGLIAWALLAPDSLRPVYRTWMHFGVRMGAIMNPIILGLVFALVMVPVGVLMRLAGKDPLTRRVRSDCESYRQHSRHRDGKSMERPF